VSCKKAKIKPCDWLHAHTFEAHPTVLGFTTSRVATYHWQNVFKVEGSVHFVLVRQVHHFEHLAQQKGGHTARTAYIAQSARHLTGLRCSKNTKTVLGSGSTVWARRYACCVFCFDKYMHIGTFQVTIDQKETAILMNTSPTRTKGNKP